MGSLVDIAYRARPRAPMTRVEQASVSIANGVESDVRGREGPRQVTVLDRESWQRASEEAGADLPWTARRANLLVEGVALARTTGRMLRIGELVLEVSEETEPCAFMDKTHKGLREALAPEWRGGVSCRVIREARIRVGDPVALIVKDRCIV